MKKNLLCGIAFIALSTTLFAQSPVVIYNGTVGQLFNSSPMAFDSAHVMEDSIGSNKYMEIWGTSPDTSLRVGDVTNAAYDVFNSILPLGYTGTVASSSLTFRAYTDTTMAGLMIEFVTNSQIMYGYKWDSIPGSDTGFVTVTIPLAEFTTVVDGKLTSVAITDQLLQGTISQVRFVLLAKDSSSFASVGLDDIIIGNSMVTGLETNTLGTQSQTVYPNPCHTGTLFLGEESKEYSITNASGAFVLSGKGKTADVSGLNSGIYYIKIDADVQKVIVN